jgi:predicted DNA-binding transcriptional regulator YafY
VRADRLVALLLILQRRQNVTAAEVADELEVSERTARRDLEALSMAGLPVYSERGRGGGWRLLGGGRTDLTGLTGPEARALFLVAGPSTAASPELKAALRKLVQALPETFRQSAEQAASSIVLDHAGWGKVRRPFHPQHLEVLQEATTQGRQVLLGYDDRSGQPTERRAHPLGLALKGNTWYVLAGTDVGLRTFRVSRVRSVTLLAEAVTRPDGFDLERAWADVVDRVDSLREQVQIVGCAKVEVLGALRWVFERQLTIGDQRPDGRVAIVLRGQGVRLLAGQLAAFGDSVEVSSPPSAVAHLAMLGAQLSSMCAKAGPECPP